MPDGAPPRKAERLFCRRIPGPAPLALRVLLRHKPKAQLIVGLSLAGVWLLYALHTSLGVGGKPLDAADTPIYDGLLVAAALVCLLRVRLLRQERAAWALIGAGLAV